MASVLNKNLVSFVLFFSGPVLYHTPIQREYLCAFPVSIRSSSETLHAFDFAERTRGWVTTIRFVGSA